MDITPIKAAEEAALAAVNLGPAISASSPLPETTESLTQTHGLLILERDPTGEPTWFACKFCPIFGAEKSREGYLRLYRAPFKRSRIEFHLKRDHADHWDQYRVLDPEQKLQFFHGKRLPPPSVFHERMKHLEKAWAPTPRKRKAQKLVVDADNEIQNIRLMKRHKLYIVHNFSKPLAIDDDWIGRSTFRPIESTSENVHSEFPKCKRPLPGRNFDKLLCGVLERYSEPFSEDLRRLIKQPADPAGLQDAALTPPWSEDGKVTLASRALFYLLRGFPVDVASTLLQESAQFGWPLMRSSDVDIEMPDIAEQTDVNEETTISESLPDMKPVIPTESLVTFVSDTAHFIEMAALLALKRFLKERDGWAIALATRPCSVRNDALEILIPIQAPSLASDCGPKAKEAPPSVDTASQPKNIETDNPPLDVTDVKNSMSDDDHEHSIVKASAAKLLSHAVTVFLLDGARQNLSQKGPAKLRSGVRKRVRLVLMDALEFFCETIGPERARTSLKEISNIRKLATDWLLSAPTDDEAFESANSSYKAAGLRLPEIERQIENKVLRGLRLCVRTAKDSLRGSFHSPTIYAREVLNKAILDFDTTMPALWKMPSQQDPLHLISVRDETDAVETVTRLFDFVCPDWPGKLIGITSDISSDSPLKPLETKLVEALKERRGFEFVIVDKSVSDGKPPITPSGIMNMTPLQFKELVHIYVKNCSPIQKERTVDTLTRQREILIERKQEKLKDSWASLEDFRALASFVRGIELLWSRNHCKIGSACRFSGTISDETDDRDTSDRDIERVLRARTLMDAEQRQLLDEADPRMQWTDISPWKDYLVSWGGNWSNLTLSASD